MLVLHLLISCTAYVGAQDAASAGNTSDIARGMISDGLQSGSSEAAAPGFVNDLIDVASNPGDESFATAPDPGGDLVAATSEPGDDMASTTPGSQGSILAGQDVRRDRFVAALGSEEEAPARPLAAGGSRLAAWFAFMELLVTASDTALRNIRFNIKNNDYFDPNYKTLLDEMFRNVDDYENTLRSELKKIIDDKDFDVSEKSMLEAMNVTNVLIGRVVVNNLHRMEYITPTKWYKNLKDKILRQELKAAAGYIAKKMCDKGVCEEKKVFSDYVKTWLRYLLNLKPSSMREFFGSIPGALDKHKHFVKANVKFRKIVLHVAGADVVSQKDHLALLDEILINPGIMQSMPSRAAKVASLLLLVSEIVDHSYELGAANRRQLGDVTRALADMLEGRYRYVPAIFDNIMENLQINHKIWPLQVQSKLDNLWTEIIH